MDAETEKRLKKLEKHSHPPIDLEPAIREIVKNEVARQLTALETPAHIED